MNPRNLGLALALVALVLFAGQAALAADKTHEGKVVQAGNGKLTMKDKDGNKEHTHTVPATATITCDGKECKLEDLKAGYTIKVTTKDDAQNTVTKIEAKKDQK